MPLGEEWCPFVLGFGIGEWGEADFVFSRDSCKVRAHYWYQFISQLSRTN